MRFRHIAALTTLAFAGACQDEVELAAPEAAVAFAAGPKTSVTPDGQALGTLIDSIGPRTRYRLEYHNGPVMSANSNVYFIWYGNWNVVDSAAVPLITSFATSLGGSPYFRTTTLYANTGGQAPSGGLIFGGSTDNLYSHGVSLTKADAGAVVIRELDQAGLPVDPRGIYVVLPTPDVAVTDLTQRTCAFRQHLVYNGTAIKYVFINNPARYPTVCVTQSPGPNGTLAADAIASLLAAELANTVTDPTSAAWFDRLGYEVGDKCAWNYGATYTAANGARANVRLGGRDWLLQQLWAPLRNSGYCTLATP